MEAVRNCLKRDGRIAFCAQARFSIWIAFERASTGFSSYSRRHSNGAGDNPLVGSSHGEDRSPINNRVAILL